MDTHRTVKNFLVAHSEEESSESLLDKLGVPTTRISCHWERVIAREPARRGRQLAFLLVAAGANGCSSSDPMSELANELDAAVSSTATAQLTLEDWLGNRVPVAYAERTLDEERQRLDDGISAMTNFAGADSLRALAIRSSQDASNAARIGNALARHDAVSAEQHLRQLRASADMLRALSARATGDK